MKKLLVLIILVAALAGGAWFLLRDDGLVEQVTEERIEAALIEKGAPPQLAGCMAGRMVDRLSLLQLKKLERLRAQEGESGIPISPGDLLARIRRVDDPEAVEQLASAAALCSLGLGGD